VLEALVLLLPTEQILLSLELLLWVEGMALLQAMLLEVLTVVLAVAVPTTLQPEEREHWGKGMTVELQQTVALGLVEVALGKPVKGEITLPQYQHMEATAFSHLSLVLLHIEPVEVLDLFTA
jgi:hypothetical protein